MFFFKSDIMKVFGFSKMAQNTNQNRLVLHSFCFYMSVNTKMMPPSLESFLQWEDTDDRFVGLLSVRTSKWLTSINLFSNFVCCFVCFNAIYRTDRLQEICFKYNSVWATKINNVEHQR